MSGVNPQAQVQEALAQATAGERVARMAALLEGVVLSAAAAAAATPSSTITPALSHLDAVLAGVLSEALGLAGTRQVLAEVCGRLHPPLERGDLDAQLLVPLLQRVIQGLEPRRVALEEQVGSVSTSCRGAAVVSRSRCGRRIMPLVPPRSRSRLSSTQLI